MRRPVEREGGSGGKTSLVYEEKPWKRIIVLAAGAFFNFVSAIIFSFIFIVAVGYIQPEVYTLYADESGNNYCAELRVGDRIVAEKRRENRYNEDLRRPCKG